MMDLRELYQEVILDHSRRPRNQRRLTGATCSAHGKNPLCGDEVELYLRIENGRVADVSFEGNGCAIAKASASLLTGAIKDKTVAEVERLFERFRDLVTGAPGGDDDLERLGKLAVFAGVREFPMRVKCASLPWHTLHAALQGDQRCATTE